MTVALLLVLLVFQQPPSLSPPFSVKKIKTIYQLTHTAAKDNVLFQNQMWEERHGGSRWVIKGP